MAGVLPRSPTGAALAGRHRCRPGHRLAMDATIPAHDSPFSSLRRTPCATHCAALLAPPNLHSTLEPPRQPLWHMACSARLGPRVAPPCLAPPCTGAPPRLPYLASLGPRWTMPLSIAPPSAIATVPESAITGFLPLSWVRPCRSTSRRRAWPCVLWARATWTRVAPPPCLDRQALHGLRPSALLPQRHSAIVATSAHAGRLLGATSGLAAVSSGLHGSSCSSTVGCLPSLCLPPAPQHYCCHHRSVPPPRALLLGRESR